MSNTPSDPSARPGGLLSGVKGSSPEADAGEELLPTWDVTTREDAGEPPLEAIPLAIPVAIPAGEKYPLAIPLPVARPVLPTAASVPPPAELPPIPEVCEAPQQAPEAESLPSAPPSVPVPARPTRLACPACTTENPIEQPYCGDCGYYFSQGDLAAVEAFQEPQAQGALPSMPLASLPAAGVRVANRYSLGELISDRLGVKRYRGTDHGAPDSAMGATERSVIVVQQAFPAAIPAALAPTEAQGTHPDVELTEEEILPGFDEPPSFPVTEIMPARPAWPSIAWERRLLRTLEHPGLPAELDYFADETHEYLILEAPTGTLLWDAWDDPDAGADQKFGYLVEVAEILHRLHQCNAIVEGLRPDIVVIQPDPDRTAGRVRLADVSDLLPLPVPTDAPLRGRLYTAPELLRATGAADARSDLYSFGAMLYALQVGRELNERTDFDGPGNPKAFIPRFPDCHPAMGRLMMKTFRKEVEARFPTDEAGKEDATGFTELIRTLEVLRRTHDTVRLDIGCYTSTGIVRTGNEDAFALMHACESRQEDLGEAVLIILCDGMGGYEAGEVAAALTIQSLRQNLSKLKPFDIATGATPFVTDPLTQMSKHEGHTGPRCNVEAVKQALKAALREANSLVFKTSRLPGSKRRGMGCTAEVVYIDGRDVVVGHVGDSRTYHLHEGRLVQLTRDQTLVNRLVELGTLTAEEAETHPRRNELQQAIGGQPDVDPGLYHGKLVVGDWVVVCSDGLTNHVTSRDLQQMLQSEASSAEMAARRLVNLTLIEGATDNVTVVAVRLV